jgi:hypothetical protein
MGTKWPINSLIGAPSVKDGLGMAGIRASSLTKSPRAKKMGEIGDRAFAGEMKGAFMDIYDQFGLWLNKMFLKRDIEEMEARKEWIKEGWTPLSELLESGPESSKEAKILSNEVRNFFAHSGLGKSVVEVRKCGEDIELRYKRDRLNEVREWLIKSMG